MKAAKVKKYDKNNIKLMMADVERPSIGRKDVLVKVRAAGINPLDNMISRGEVK